MSNVGESVTITSAPTKGRIPGWPRTVPASEVTPPCACAHIDRDITIRKQLAATAPHFKVHRTLMGVSSRRPGHGSTNPHPSEMDGIMGARDANLLRCESVERLLPERFLRLWFRRDAMLDVNYPTACRLPATGFTRPSLAGTRRVEIAQSRRSRLRSRRTRGLSGVIDFVP